MEIVPENQNIEKVFSGTVYNIDFYQRDYKWGKENIYNLLDDIFYKFNSEYSPDFDVNQGNISNKYTWYYLNTYVVNKVEGKTYIVDGQQRLTTLTLILIKLYHLSKYFNSMHSNWLRSKICGDTPWGITQDEYDKKAVELKQRQYELADRLKRITEVDENYSITLISLLNICSRAPELFESSKVEQKRQIINFLLSNLKLRGKKLEFELKKPFEVLVNIENCSNWLATVDKVRTKLLSLNEDIFIPELSF
jgi:uncharacterized protein with ParB-like and HNH nuclease domain